MVVFAVSTLKNLISIRNKIWIIQMSCIDIITQLIG
jgi:hypothetical protein